jgi:hypothetical protein
MSAPAPKPSIPRSPAGLLTTQGPLDDRLGTSPSGQSGTSISHQDLCKADRQLYPDHQHLPLAICTNLSNDAPQELQVDWTITTFLRMPAWELLPRLHHSP